MFITTRIRKAKAVQYNGDIEPLKQEFPLLQFKELKSKTTWNNNVYVDYSVSDGNRTEDLIAGDFVIRENDKWDILPLYEYETYWVNNG